MQSENEYIGDEKFKKFLAHYACPSRLDVIKMKFAGAICSPNLSLRPTDVISSLWEENNFPRLETKAEAELFFKFFMGLWDKMFEDVARNRLTLPEHDPIVKKDLSLMCRYRFEEVEYGFLEGFWGGCTDLKLPAYVAETVDSLSEMADSYAALGKQALKEQKQAPVRDTYEQTDRLVGKVFGFIIENTVLPRLESISRTMQ